MGLDISIPSIGSVRPTHMAASQGLLTNNLTSGDTEGVSFSDFFNEAVSNVAGSDYLDKTTNVGLMTGTIDNLHTATIAAEKAEIMLNLTVQVRNKLVEGYQEIMRMQI